MPYQRNPHFTGRDELLDQLYITISETNRKKYNHRVALFGLGGVGKTQVAIEYAYRNEPLYSGIYWISAVDENALLSGFLEIAKQTKCVPNSTKLKPKEVAERVLSWLRRQPTWLLIYDNLDDIKVIKNYLVDMASEGHTLITTRNPNAISIPAEGLEVSVLDVQGAIDLLCTRSEIVVVDVVKDEATQIVTELGCLPLAIEQAAAYVREASKDMFTFLQTYRVNRKAFHERVPHGNWDYTLSVATTWLLAFDVIAKMNAGAAKLLQLFAFLNPDLILIEFLQAGLDGLDDQLQEVVRPPVVFQDALFLLEQFSLIRRGKSGITMHRLVQIVVKDNMTEAETYDRWNAAIGLCHAAFPESSAETLILCRRYQEQVMMPLASRNFNNSSRFLELLVRVGRFLRWQIQRSGTSLAQCCSRIFRITRRGTSRYNVFYPLSPIFLCSSGKVEGRGQTRQAEPKQ
jgi:NB-ARC domain